jgi:hypothetical protein
MAEAAGDVLTLATPTGHAEARRMGQAEAGESRGCIRYSWGTETFYGTAEQALTHITKRGAEQEAATPKQPPLGKGDMEWRA